MSSGTDMAAKSYDYISLIKFHSNRYDPDAASSLYKTTSSSTNKMPYINKKPTNSAHDAHDGCQYEHETDHDTSKVDTRYRVDYHEYVGVAQLSVGLSISWQPCSWSDRLEGIIVL